MHIMHVKLNILVLVGGVILHAQMSHTNWIVIPAMALCFYLFWQVDAPQNRSNWFQQSLTKELRYIFLEGTVWLACICVLIAQTSWETVQTLVFVLSQAFFAGFLFAVLEVANQETHA